MNYKVYFIILTTLILSGSLDLSAANRTNFRHRLNQLEKDYTIEDIKAEIAFGKDLAAKILQKYPLIQNKNWQEYISLLGAGIAGQIGRPELSFHFAIIDSNEINAYACPGGFIFITSGAFQSMKNEAQLAGVIAHEIAHVNERHIVKKLRIRAKGDGFTTGIANLLGSATASARILLTQLTDKAFSLLFEEGIDKSDEYNADALGSETLILLGYSWGSYRDYLSSIKINLKKGQGQVLLKTHPSIDERIDRINNLANILAFNNFSGKKNEKRFREYLNLH